MNLPETRVEFWHHRPLMAQSFCGILPMAQKQIFCRRKMAKPFARVCLGKFCDFVFYEISSHILTRKSCVCISVDAVAYQLVPMVEPL